MKRLSLLLAVLLVLQINCTTQSSGEDPRPGDEGDDFIEVAGYVFVGTYTRDEGWVNGKAEGIYRLNVDIDNNSLSSDTVAAELVNPSFVAISPDGRNLYAVSEMARQGETGFVYAYEIDGDGNLNFIDRYPTNAQAPAYVAVHPSGELVFASNYVGGVAMVYKRNDNGSLEVSQQLDHSGSGPHPNQNASHPHMTKISPDGNYLYIPDLGSDKIWSYEIDLESGSVSKTVQEFGSVAAGSGPRHMDFHPTENIAYVMNELNSTVSVFNYDPQSGSLNEKQVISTLPENFSDWNSTADIHVHESGKFLYGSNRGHNSLVSYEIDEDSGELSLLAHTSTEGEFPRNFNIHPNGEALYVANQNSDNITLFDLDPETGVLSFTGESIEVPTPVCIVLY